MSEQCILTSYHNHSVWSDGSSSIETIIESARDLGITELGISDHLAVHPPRDIDWSMSSGQCMEYLHLMQDLQRRTEHPRLRVGVEIDFLPGSIDEVRSLVGKWEVDYLIGSVHFVDGFQVDDLAEDWRTMTEGQRNQVWRGYWQAVRDMARSGVFDIVGHLDLPKKFGFRPTADLTAEIQAALLAIAQSGMTVEINTSGHFFPAGEMYPSPELLAMVKASSIPIVINADAHEPDHLTRRFGEARSLAGQLGFTHTVAFERRKKRLIPLSCHFPGSGL